MKGKSLVASLLAMLLLMSLTAVGFAASNGAIKRRAPAAPPLDRSGDVSPMISSITNAMTITPTTFNGGANVTFNTSTVYDWQFEPNGYYSNYLVSVDWVQFYKPVVDSYTMPNNVNPVDFGYVSSDSYLNGNASWQYYSGCCFFFFTKETWSLNFHATADPNMGSGTTRKNFHGQHSNGWDSTGPGATVYTTHN